MSDLKYPGFTFFYALIIINTILLLLEACSTQSMRSPSHILLDSGKTVDHPSNELTNYQAVANSEQITLVNFNMSNQGNHLIVKPSQSIPASTQYVYHCQTCLPNLNNQIIIGLKGRSAQSCIYDGGISGQGSADFSLKAPAKPGKYEVYFRAIQAENCSEALKIAWAGETNSAKGNTIGTILVSRKASIPQE